MQSTKRRVLCIEPHTDICSMLSTLLHLQGFETESAATVADALIKAQSGDFSVYIIDDAYIDGTNIELCLKLRALTPHTPILFFSTQGFDADRQKAIEAGAQEYLTKPASIFELAEVVHHLSDGTFEAKTRI